MTLLECWLFVLAISPLPLLITPHPAPKARPSKELKPVKVKYGDSCNQTAYDYLFNGHYSESSTDPKVEFMKYFQTKSFTIYTPTPNNTPNENKTLFVLDFIEDLCIDVKDNLAADIFKFDCKGQDDSPLVAAYDPWSNRTGRGKCLCGHVMNWVDPNVYAAPAPPGSLIMYTKTLGLDLRLTYEDGKCVSGLNGHCNDTLYIPLKCAAKLTCEPYFWEGHPFVNLETGVTYGICVTPNPDENGEQINAGNRRVTIKLYVFLVFLYFFNKLM